jgi:hypothetical protein
VSFEELCSAVEEKDATILELQQAAKTACAALETEKKQVAGESPLLILCLPLGFVEIFALVLLSFCFQVCRLLLGHQRRGWRRSRGPTTPPSKN